MNEELSGEVVEASTEMEEAAKASEVEATNGKAPKIFQVPDTDISLVLPDRWKRMKFLKAMKIGDLWGAFQSIWPDVDGFKKDEYGEEYLLDEETGEKIPDVDRDGRRQKETHPELAKLEECDMDDSEFRLLLERLGETLMGRKSAAGKAGGK
jgi:hypothetical protein